MTETAAPAPPAPSFRAALAWWLRLGCISFGGPAGQIALMHEELVTRRRWISEARFLHALNYCMLLPGPEAQQLATYVGWLLHGPRGGIAAGVLFVLPSLCLLLALSAAYFAFGNLPWVAAVFAGIKPAVLALVVQAGWRLGSRTLRSGPLRLIALAAFGGLLAGLHFPWIVAGAALAGWVGGRRRPDAFRTGGGHGAGGAGTPAGPSAVIDDHTPVDPARRFRPTGLAAVLVAGALLWALPMAALWALHGGQAGALWHMGAFFTQAALLTFGGAYAVLPFVTQAATAAGWITPPQMLDGLALGESTPGPLIMIVAFVGFAGGWQLPELQALAAGWVGAGAPAWAAPLAAGTVAATVATWFTFLPSFVFIFAGAPLVEATRGRHGVTAPLTAISAAVVGVIAHLALFFAVHVLWPAGGAPGAAGLDALAVAIALAAGVALIRFGVGVITVLGVAAAVGWLAHLLR